MLRIMMVSAACVVALAIPAAADAGYVTQDVVANTDPGVSTAVVNYIPPSVTNDGALPMVPATCTPLPGSAFALGDTVVSCNGMGQIFLPCPDPMTCVPTSLPVQELGTFKVTVKDGEAPTFGDFPDVTAATLPGATSSVVNYATPPASDNVGVTSVVCGPASGTALPVGVTDVTCTASDSAGNTSTKTMHATVTATPGQSAPSTSSGDNGTGTSTDTPAAPVQPTAPVKPSAPMQPSAPVVRCVAPKLTGLTLAAAKKRLKAAHCKLGKVTRTRGGKASVVRKQSLKAGRKKPAGTKVNLKLGPR